DPGREPAQAATEVAVLRHLRRPERHRARIVAVARRGPKCAADEARPIPFVSIKRKRIGERARIEPRSRPDAEPRRDDWHRRGWGRGGAAGWPVGARPAHGAESHAPNGRILATPRAEIAAGSTPRDDLARAATDELPASSRALRPGHDRGELPRRPRVADLVDAENRGGGPPAFARGGGRGGAGRGRRR